MFVDLSCPAEVFRAVPPTEDIPAVSLTLFNLSDRVIASVEVLLRQLDAGGDETERLSFRGRALNGRPHSTFLMTVPCAPAGRVKTYEARIEKVWFADNEVWRRDPARETEYIPNEMPICPALTNLKFTAGETAVGYPSVQNGLWVCICGRPNPESGESCARCGRLREEVFSRFTPEAVEAQINMRERQLDLNSRNMREDTIRMQRLREEEYKAKMARRGRRWFLAACLAGTLALAAGSVFLAAPGLRLLAGRRKMESGDYTAAREIFISLGSFGRAGELAAECDWQTALIAADQSESAEALARASEVLRSMADRPEALEKANETDLLRARMLLQRGDRQGALEAAALLPDGYEGKDALLADCRMAEGRALMNVDDYEAAREIFLSLTDNPEARELAAECLYQPAKMLIADGDWDGAIEVLSNIPDYRDSRNMTLECHYRKAIRLEEDGDLAGASDEYLLAGDFGDARDKSTALTYRMAEALFTEGDLKGAQTLYASIPDYKDANEKDRQCRYNLALDAAEDLEYSRVLELLSGIPDDYRGTRQLRAEACYQRAKAAADREDWAAAAELLAQADRKTLVRRHKDAERLYLQACEAAGIEPVTPEEEPGETPETAPAATPEPNPFLVTEDD